ncbi:DUF3397 domain-containing protein [Paenibacillus thermotolerans]|uniref:DUF3397 domain-containing protein n=1 Tax=Paenibacillus thermotolerans TaxID=3027807 RepID=UPI00236803B3|nr:MULTISPECIES: DUF3397 domain-containing protein [unclassified Paenibacillus]
MQALKDILVTAYAALSVVPFIGFAVVWFAIYLWKKDKKTALFRAMDFSTLLLIGSVSVLYNSVFRSTFGIYLLLLIFLIGFGILGNAQHRKRGTIDAKKIFRAVWRLGFVGLSAAYLILSVINMTQILIWGNSSGGT